MGHAVFSLHITKKDSGIKNRIDCNLCKLSNLEKHSKLQFCITREELDTRISLWHRVIAKHRDSKCRVHLQQMLSTLYLCNSLLLEITFRFRRLFDASDFNYLGVRLSTLLK